MIAEMAYNCYLFLKRNTSYSPKMSFFISAWDPAFSAITRNPSSMASTKADVPPNLSTSAGSGLNRNETRAPGWPLELHF